MRQSFTAVILCTVVTEKLLLLFSFSSPSPPPNSKTVRNLHLCSHIMNHLACFIRKFVIPAHEITIVVTALNFEIMYDNF